ncbi:NAD-dependent epimerase/dehydratase family protein [Catelliglobosispora koreensis]|uniref:NAD-dependent epimerase/dehydratase family protein n=1 Tax=Catelliglobosispora koreensis TaxID=129052 RepID=UPI00037A1C12|nr:NAD-dependent epimerase/dehydratase family protein [Catelliglobosispora koreensis]
METANEIVEQDLAYITSTLKEEFAKLQGEKLLIVGGAGFLGYYLVQSALKAGVDVTVYDNFMRGIPDWLLGLEGNAKLTVTKHDITQPLPADADFTYLIHAGSIASPTFYRNYPIETMDANVNGLRNLLEYGKANPIKGFLFYSSSEIYGDPDPAFIPTPEDYRGYVSCTGPRACYDEAKRYGETLCVNFARVHNLPVTVARPFNNYGPGLKITDRRVIPDFVRDVMNGRDIVMLSDGSPMRTFCYVADAVIGYYKVLVNGRPGEAYNIGVETPEISMAELAERIVVLGKELFGYEGKVVRQESTDAEYLIDNPNRRCPIITKAREQVGYDPQIGIEEGLRRSMLWYNGNRVAEDA